MKSKLQVFISSRVHSEFQLKGVHYALTDLRQYIKSSLDNEEFLGEQILDVIINEQNFYSSIAKNVFDGLIAKMNDSNIIIILYNGEAGWSAEGVPTFGICHEEFLVAAEKFSELTNVIDLSDYFTLPDSGEAKQKNDLFQDEVKKSSVSKVGVTGKTVEDIQEFVLTEIKGFILATIESSFAVRKQIVAGAGTFGESLDWSKMNYSERQEKIIEKLKVTFDSLPGLSQAIKAYWAIPDNMSVAEARNRIGRPFIDEHDLINHRPEKSGVIHFIAVYGNATEIQVKNLVGYPDLTVIKSSFGYYLWEKTTHIQMFFLVKCNNPSKIVTSLTRVNNWLHNSRELPRIVNRAKARYSILEAIVNTHGMAGL
jgi:hypothetical protein